MPPKRKNIINHGEDCSEDLYIKAHDTLMNKIFTNKKPLTKEDARNLKDLAVLSDAQFETIYGLYLEALKIPSYEEQPQYKGTDKDSMHYKIYEFVKLRLFDDLLTIEQFNNVIKGWDTSDFDKKNLNEWYEIYKERFYENPGATIQYSNPSANTNMIAFKSKNKIDALQNEDKSRPITENDSLNKFPLKKNKKYQLHKVASPNSYLIDIMYCDKLLYLIAININTRYLFAELLNQKVGENGFSHNQLRTTKSVSNAFKKMLDKGMQVNYLSGDAEKAFLSMTKNELEKDYGIKWVPVKRMLMGHYPSFMPKMRKRQKEDPMHSSLGIIDRVIRTLRDMAYNIKVDVITPDIMEELVNQYNNAPHRTLSELAGYSVSPNDVQKNSNLENFIIRRICQNNFNVKSKPGFKLEENQKVYVYNEKDSLMKRRAITQPGEYVVKEFVNGVYKIEGDEDSPQYIPRYKLLPKH